MRGAKQVSKERDWLGTLLGVRPATLRKAKEGWSRQERAAIGVISILAFLLFWEAIVTYFKALDPLFVSAPSLILAAGQKLLVTGELFRHASVTLQNLSIGFVLAALVGNFVGIAMGRMKYLDYAGHYYRDLREYLAALEEAGKLRRTWEKLAQQGQPV